MSTERAPRGTLTRDRVVDAALSLADEQGLDALTMRALARRLDVKPMAIYHHVAGKDAILDLVVDRVFAEIDLPVPGRPWRPEIRRRALSARSVLLAHPWSISLLETRSVAQNPATLRHHDAVIGTLRRGGFGLAPGRHPDHQHQRDRHGSDTGNHPTTVVAIPPDRPDLSTPMQPRRLFAVPVALSY